MALTDPELDLLQEMLVEDPTADVYLQVGEELVRRGRWDDAEAVLSRGIGDGAPPLAWGLLARAALESGNFAGSLAALEHVAVDPASAPESARIRILALERSGRVDEARDSARRFLEVDGDDVVVQAVMERLDAPAPDAGRRAADPFYTVERAERYVAIGRPDRAVRVYRRILLHNPGDTGIELRLRQLSSGPFDGVSDDLSEELTDPGLVPPDPIDMPATSLTPKPVQRTHAPPVPADDGTLGADDENTEAVDVRETLARYARTPDGTPRDKDDAEGGKKRRRRRSLIRR